VGPFWTPILGPDWAPIDILVLPPEVKKVIQARAVPVGSLSHAELVAEGGL
jgi:hypothetical protein